MKDLLSAVRSAVIIGLLAAVLPPTRAQPPPSSTVFDVRTFGAAGDGKTLDHAAINQAIEAAHRAGGGTVRLPAGTYRCFSIHLQSRVTIQFDPGATIMAADPTLDAGRYDPAEPNAADAYQDFGHSHWHNSLLWGEDLENVAIIGPGLIDGEGLTIGWHYKLKAALKLAPEPTPSPANTPAPPRKFGYPDPEETLPDGIGNKAIALRNCRDVTLRDFSILRGGHFGILATGVDGLAIDHLKIDTNRDGMDIDACRDVHVTDCSVNSPWDDAICLKASDGLGHARDTEDVTITGCCVFGDYQLGAMLDGTWKHLPSGDRVPRTGRIKFGTESTGGFRHIVISNCVFNHCNGLAIESVDGGIIEDVSVSNLAMHDITGAPIFLRLGARLRGPEGTVVGAIRRVAISNVTYTGANARFGSILSGIPGHPLEDVLISNVRGVQDGGGTEQDAQRKPEELVDHYPDPRMFGEMPSWGLYVRHATGLTVRDVGLRLAKPDARPCVVLDDVTASSFSDLDVVGLAGGKQLFMARGVAGVRVRDCANTPDQTLNAGPDGSR